MKIYILRKWREIKYLIHVCMIVFPSLDEKVSRCTSIYHISTCRNRDWGMKRSVETGQVGNFRGNRLPWYTRLFPAVPHLHAARWKFCVPYLYPCIFVAFLCSSFSRWERKFLPWDFILTHFIKRREMNCWLLSFTNILIHSRGSIFKHRSIKHICMMH